MSIQQPDEFLVCRDALPGRPNSVGNQGHGRSDGSINDTSFCRTDGRYAKNVEQHHDELREKYAKEQIVHIEQSVGSRDANAAGRNEHALT